MSDKTLKRILLALNILLFAGLLAFSVIFFVTNKTWNPKINLNQGIDYEKRFFWRGTAEKIMLTCEKIHLYSHWAVLVLALGKKKILPAVKLTLYYAALMILMLICIAPFFCLDADFRWDYVFMVRLTAVRLLPLWGAAVVISLGQKLYQKIAARR